MLAPDDYAAADKGVTMSNLSLDAAIAVVGAVPGVLALLGSAVAFGRLQQRLTDVEKSVERLKDLADKVTRIDERTYHTGTDVADIRQNVKALTEALLRQNQAPLPRL